MNATITENLAPRAAVQEELGVLGPRPFKDYLKPANDARAAIEKVRLPHQTPEKMIYQGGGFDDLMAQMPRVDPLQSDQSAEVATIRGVMEQLRARVLDKIEKGEIVIPKVPDGQMARIILAIEEPRETLNPDGSTELHAGTEIVIAIWGKGFTSPVHGHAPGYVYEDCLSGGFDVHTFKIVGDSFERQAVYDKTFTMDEPGIFCSEFRPEVGQAPRTELPHNFTARRQSYSLHILPEHVRDGSNNGIRVLNTPESGPLPEYITDMKLAKGYEVSADEVTRVTKDQLIDGLQVGDVFLVRSNNVAFLGDHFVVITGGMIEKPHGLRPQEVTFLVPHTERTPLDSYPLSEGLVILKLNDEARDRFHAKHAFPPEIKQYDAPRIEVDARLRVTDQYPGMKEHLEELFASRLQKEVYGPVNSFYRECSDAGTNPTLGEQRALLIEAKARCEIVCKDFLVELDMTEAHKRGKEMKLGMVATIDAAEGLTPEAKLVLRNELEEVLKAKKEEAKEKHLGGLSFSEATPKQQLAGTLDIVGFIAELNAALPGKIAEKKSIS